MKTLSKANLISLLCLALAGSSAALAQARGQQQKTATASANLSVSTANGQTVVTYNGKQVFAGPTTSAATGRSSSVNGVAYAAVFDGDKVLWENVPGAAQQLSAAGQGTGGLDQQKFMEQHRRTVEEQQKFIEQHQNNFNVQGGGTVKSVSSTASISVKTVNNETVVTYEDKEYPVGPTRGPVSAKAKSVNGVSYAAAFDGDRVIWENVPGAAQKVK